MYCPNCMRYNNYENAVRCQYCNEPMNIQNNTFQLPVGTILAGRYYVGKVLGQGGFGITYVGCDLKLNMKVAIKEYYPQGMIGRIAKYDLGLTVNSGNQETEYEKQKERFLKEAKILAEFASNIRIVRVTDIFEENNTAYIIMEYVEGITLESYCKQYGKLNFDDLWQMLQPLVTTLGKIHERGLIHRDISPSNIMINEETGIKLIDFGAARDYSSADDKSLSVVLKPGYAPPEQYSGHGQGPWTDVYALCATMYRAITGVVPVNSIERITNDSLKHPSDMGDAIKPEQEAVLMSGLAVKRADRIQSMRELQEAVTDANKRTNIVRAEVIHKNQSQGNNELSLSNSIDIEHNDIVYSDDRIPQFYSIGIEKVQIEDDVLKRREFEYRNIITSIASASGIESYERIIQKIQRLGDYKETKALAENCLKEINCLREEENRKNIEKSKYIKKPCMKGFDFFIVIVAACVIIGILLLVLIMPNKKIITLQNQ